MSYKKLKDILNEYLGNQLKSDISKEGLDYAFPEVRELIIYDEDDSINTIYDRINNDNFVVRGKEDLISGDKILYLIKQSMSEGSHDLSIIKTKDGYVVHIYPRHLDTSQAIELLMTHKVTRLRFVHDRKNIAGYEYTPKDDEFYNTLNSPIVVSPESPFEPFMKTIEIINLLKEHSGNWSYEFSDLGENSEGHIKILYIHIDSLIEL